MTKPKSPSTPYNGILTHDSVIDGYIAFPTRTDAMVASLALSLRIDSTAMDVVFAILHDPTFNLAEMRLRRTEDIYLHVAEQRRKDAEPRIISSIPSERIIADLEVAQSRTTIPPIVLEEVIALMDEEIGHNQATNKIDQELTQSLKNLALVQRRYTLPARRALARHFIYRNPKRDKLLNELIRNPYLGPWTHNFALLVTKKLIDRENVGEVIQYMTTLHAFFTERITGLRTLTLEFEKAVLTTDHFEGIFSSLRELRELKLVPHYCQRSDPLLSASQCRTILSLPKLKHLTIDSWSPLAIPTRALPSNLALFTPSPSFQAFLIKDYPLYHQVGDQLCRKPDIHITGLDMH